MSISVLQLTETKKILPRLKKQKSSLKNYILIKQNIIKNIFQNITIAYKELTGSDIRLRGIILSGGGQPNLWPHFEKLVELAINTRHRYWLNHKWLPEKYR